MGSDNSKPKSKGRHRRSRSRDSGYEDIVDDDLDPNLRVPWENCSSDEQGRAQPAVLTQRLGLDAVSDEFTAISPSDLGLEAQHPSSGPKTGSTSSVIEAPLPTSSLPASQSLPRVQPQASSPSESPLLGASVSAKDSGFISQTDGRTSRDHFTTKSLPRNFRPSILRNANSNTADQTEGPKSPASPKQVQFKEVSSQGIESHPKPRPESLPTVATQSKPRPRSKRKSREKAKSVHELERGFLRLQKSTTPSSEVESSVLKTGHLMSGSHEKSTRSKSRPIDLEPAGQFGCKIAEEKPSSPRPKITETTRQTITKTDPDAAKAKSSTSLSDSQRTDVSALDKIVSRFMDTSASQSDIQKPSEVANLTGLIRGKYELDALTEKEAEKDHAARTMPQQNPLDSEGLDLIKGQYKLVQTDSENRNRRDKRKRKMGVTVRERGQVKQGLHSETESSEVIDGKSPVATPVLIKAKYELHPPDSDEIPLLGNGVQGVESSSGDSTPNKNELHSHAQRSRPHSASDLKPADVQIALSVVPALAPQKNKDMLRSTGSRPHSASGRLPADVHLVHNDSPVLSIVKTRESGHRSLRSRPNSASDHLPTNVYDMRRDESGGTRTSHSPRSRPQSASGRLPSEVHHLHTDPPSASEASLALRINEETQRSSRSRPHSAAARLTQSDAIPSQRNCLFLSQKSCPHSASRNLPLRADNSSSSSLALSKSEQNLHSRLLFRNRSRSAPSRPKSWNRTILREETQTVTSESVEVQETIIRPKPAQKPPDSLSTTEPAPVKIELLKTPGSSEARTNVQDVEKPKLNVEMRRIPLSTRKVTTFTIQTLGSDLNEKKEEVNSLSSVADEVKPAVSQHDRDLVDDHISTVERKLGGAQEKVDKRLQTCEALASSYETVLQEISGHTEWLQQTEANVCRQPVTGLGMAQAQEVLQQHGDVVHEIEMRQATLDSLRRQADVLQSLSPKEREHVEKQIREIQTEHQKLRDTATEQHRQLRKGVSQRESYQQDLDRVLSWLQDKEKVTEPAQKTPLKSSDINKLIDAKKTLLAEVKAFTPTVEALLTTGKDLLEHTEGEEKSQMEHTLTDVDTRFNALKSGLQDSLDQTQQSLTSRRQLEDDVVKVELWCQEADAACARPLQLDGSVELLDQQCKKHQVLSQSGKVHEALLNDITERAEATMPELSDTDQVELKEQLHSLRETLNRVCGNIETRLQTLNEALTNKTRFEEELLELTRQLAIAQDQLKQVNRGISHKEEEARNTLEKVQKLQDQLVDLQPHLMMLQQSQDQLAALGTPSATEDTSRLTRQYEELREQADQQKSKLLQAVAVREQYYTNKAELETCMRQCRENMDAVDVLGVSVPTKLDRYKDVADTLHQKEPTLVFIEDKAQQICIEGTPADKAEVQHQVKTLKEKFGKLQQDANTLADQYKTAVAEREAFEKDLIRMIKFLKQKESQVKPCNQLGIDVEGVVSEMDKLQKIKEEIAKETEGVDQQMEEQKERFSELEEAVPLELQEKMDEFLARRDSLKDKISEEEDKLSQAKDYREKFSETWKVVSDWVKDAEGQLKVESEGMTFEQSQTMLDKHKEIFAEEKEIQEKMDSLLDIAEKITPTLDMNDKATLKQKLANLNDRLTALTRESDRKTKELQQSTADWKEYQDNLAKVEKFLQEAGIRWEMGGDQTPTSSQHARDQLLQAQDQLGALADNKELVLQLLAKGRELQRNADEPTRAALEKTLADIEAKWKQLNDQAEDKNKQAQQTLETLEVYEEKADALKLILDNAESQLLMGDIQKMPTTDLSKELDKSQSLNQTVGQSLADLAAFQKAGQEQLAQMPDGPAKDKLRKQLQEMQDRYERLQTQAAEQEKTLQTEAADREKFDTQVSDTMTWLQEQQKILQEAPPAGKDVDKELQQQETTKQDLALKMAQVQRVIAQIKDRYAEQNLEMPSEMVAKLEELQRAEAELAQQLEDKETELNRGKQARQDYQTNLQVVTSWLGQVEGQLDEEQGSLPEQCERHQQITGEVEIFRPKIEALQAQADTLLANATPEEKDKILSTVAELTDRWRQLQNRAEQRTGQLNEAVELWQKFDSTAEFLTGWADQAESVAKTGMVVSDLGKAEAQLVERKTLLQQATDNEAKLQEMEEALEQLEQHGDVTEARLKIEAIRERLLSAQNETTLRLTELESTVAEWKECQTELHQVKQWKRQVEYQAQVTDPSQSVEEQLVAKEQLLADITSHQDKVQQLLPTQEKLAKLSGGRDVLHAAHLPTELEELRDRVEQDRDRLRAEKHHQDTVDDLRGKVEGLQDNLEGQPGPTASMEGLRQQIQDHNALATEVRSLQPQIDEVNSMSLELTDEMRQLEQVQIAPSSEADSMSDMGSESIVLPPSTGGRDRSLSKQDSGVITSPEEPGRSVQDDQFVQTPTGEDLHKEKAHREALAPADLEHEQRQGRDVLRPGSPLSVRSDDTDALIGEYTKQLARADDAAARSDPGSTTTLTTAEGQLLPSTDDAVTARPDTLQPLDQPNSAPGSQVTPESGVSDLGTPSPVKGRAIGVSLEEDTGEPRQTGHSPDFSATDAPRTISTVVSLPSDQLGRRELELTTAMQRQQLFQDALQDVNRKLDHAQRSLAQIEATPAIDLDNRLRDIQNVQLELDLVEADIRATQERGQEIAARAPDAESRDAILSALGLLTERLHALRQQTRDREQDLHQIARDRQLHGAVLDEHVKRLREYEIWLNGARADMAQEPMVSYDTDYLQQEIEENKALQDTINARIQQLADLSVECEYVGRLESLPQAENLRTQLAMLQCDTTQLKLDAIQRGRDIKQALRDSERKRQELEDYKERVENLQRWIEETKRIAESPPRAQEATARLAAEQKNLQEQLGSDLTDHQKLLRDVSQQAQKVLEARPPGDATEPEDRAGSPEGVAANWRQLSRQLSEKKLQLQDMIELNKPQDLGEPVAYYYPGVMGYQPDTSAKMADAKRSLSELMTCWETLQGQVDDKQTRLERTLHFQQLYQDAMQNLSSWLDAVEQRIFAAPTDRDTQEHLRSNEGLLEEMQSLQTEISLMNRASQQLMSDASAESKHLIQRTVADLNERLKTLESQARDREQNLKEKDRSWKNYQDEVRDLQLKLSQARQQYIVLADSDLPLDQQEAQCKRLEAEIKEHERKLAALTQHGEEMLAQDPKVALPVELSMLQSHWLELQQQAAERKAAVQRAQSVQSQYEKMLEEYAEFLETAQAKLRIEKLSATDLPHLKQQLQAHKDFFNDLESHRTLLDNLAAAVDRATRQRYQASHTRLNNLTHIIQDKASLRGQKLERLVNQWSEYQHLFEDSQSWLGRLQQQLPEKVREDDPLEEVRKKIWDYHTVQSALNEEKPNMYQTVDKGRQLLQSVACPILEGRVTEFADKWVHLNNTTETELKKLETMVDQWEQFERDATGLEIWLATALGKLPYVGSLDDDDTGNINILRQKMELLLDFRKEVESQQPLKTKVATLGNQLLSLRPHDSVLHDRLDAIDRQWLQLLRELPNNEAQLHTAQMELLPSRQALNELMMWLELMEGVLLEDEGKELSALLEVQTMLQKYKSLKVDVTNKKLTVEFVNQSAMHTSSHDLDGSINSDRMDFAERLGNMNKRYQSVSSSVAERLKNLELLHLKWEEYEKGVNAQISWFLDQEAKIKRCHKIGHEVSVQQGLRDCKTLLDQLEEKKADIANVKTLGMTLIDSGKGSPKGTQVVNEAADKLERQRADLEQQVYGLESHLKEALKQWETYHLALQKVNRVIVETEYMMSRYRLISGDLNAFRSQIQHFKNLQSQFEESQNQLDHLLDSSSQLTESCDPVVGQSVKKMVSECQERWSGLSRQMQTRLAKLEKLEKQWEDYEEKFARVRGWLDDKEDEANQLMLHADDTSKQQHIQDVKALQGELSAHRDSIKDLTASSAPLLKNMDNATIIHVMSRETALSQRLTALLKTLAKHLQSFNFDVNRHSRFDFSFNTVDSFLQEVESALRADDAGTDESVLRERLGQLKALSTQFSHRQVDLDALNHIAYRIPLVEQKSRQLWELNQRWHKLLAETTERYKTLRSQLLLKQDFNQKCEDWLVFLAQVEKDLGKDIAGDYEGVLKQQQMYEIFQHEMYGRQQILHAIINEGHRMMRDGDVDNRAEFEEKLSLLEEQWRSVVRRANQRKVLIDGIMQQWQVYQAQSERLQERMAEMEEALHSLEVSTAPLQKIRYMLAACKQVIGRWQAFDIDACLQQLHRLLTGATAPRWVQSGQKEMDFTEPLYSKVHESGKLVMQNADPLNCEQIQADLSDVQRRWADMLHQLTQKEARLEDVLKEWRDVEDVMEELLGWLKDMRMVLSRDLPDNYDELERERQKCREFDRAFSTATDKRAHLRDCHRRLSASVSPEDLRILQQRLALLDKQWEEIKSQTLLREQLIADRLSRWSTFTEKHRELMERLERMEAKVASGREYNIEDLLHKLQHEYRGEMTEMDHDRQALLERGQHLMRSSSDIRASDIEYKISRLNDKWNRVQSLMATRQKKLQDTLRMVQQLENNMSNLRQWLARVEHELGSPVIYRQYDYTEIQRNLQEQQTLQKDIEKHSTSIASVINLCEVLLHDEDACPTTVETSAIEQAMKSLDKRWHNICTLSMERKHSIDETWRLWQRFQTEHRRFEDWLREAEKQAESPRTECATFTIFKQELRKFESFQKKVHDHLHQLENLNKQYRHLAREGRTDSAGQLRQQIQDVNARYDALSKRSDAVLRRMRHIVNVSEDFNSVLKALVTWLKDIDQNLNTLEGKPHSKTEAKKVKKALKAHQADLEKNIPRHNYIQEASSYLMQRAEASDAVKIEQEVAAFCTLYAQVSARVANMLEQPQGRGKVPGTEHVLEPTGAGFEDLLEPEGATPGIEDPMPYDTYEGPTDAVRFRASASGSGHPSEHSSRAATPASLASMDWDDQDVVTIDSSRGRDQPDGEAERWQTIRERLSHRHDKLARVEMHLQRLGQALDNLTQDMNQLERQLRERTPTGAAAEPATLSYVKLLSSCQGNIDVIKAIEQQIKEETGLADIIFSDSHIRGVMHRWEVLEAQAMEKDHRLKQQQQQWIQFQADLANLMAWLDEAEAVQATQISVPTALPQLQVEERRDREFMLQLDSRKPVVLSVNLLNKELLSADTPENRALQNQLASVNKRWDRTCARAAVWRKELQIALLQCADFQHRVQDLLIWLQKMEDEIRRNEPVNYDAGRRQLMTKYDTFLALKEELERRQAEIQTLQDTADHLLPEGEMIGGEVVSMQEKLRVLSSQHRNLLKICLMHMTRLETALGMEGAAARYAYQGGNLLNAEGEPMTGLRMMSDLSSPRSGTPILRPRSARLAGQLVTTSPLGAPTLEWASVTDNTDSIPDEAIPWISRPRRSRFLGRVMRAALPLQVLMLLLLGVACLVPMSEEDFSCVLANNFKSSMDPMLRYNDGPPPF